MSEWLSNHLIFWGSITLMATVPVIAHYWYRIRRVELETELKREMVQRGMSAEEICLVLRGTVRRERDVAAEEPAG